MCLLFTRKSQRGSTTIHEEQKSPPHHNSPCSTVNSTGIEEQLEPSPPKSHSSTVPRSAIPIWPLRAQKDSPPQQAWTPGSHSESYTSTALLQLDPIKLQILSPSTSTDSYTFRGSINSNAIGVLSLSGIPQPPLDIRSPFTPLYSSLHPPSHSSTVRQQDPHSSQSVTHQLSEDRPIRRLPTPPGVGQVPVYVPREKSGSIPRGMDRSTVSVALIEVHTETLYYYDPPPTTKPNS